jgi:hypothetical protein
MSSGSDQDEFIDYLEDKSKHEDETLFLPVPDSRPNDWTAFYTGILTGIFGGGLVPLSPWLGGLLIFGGYSITVLTLKGRGNRFSRALRFGFAFSALLGAVLLAGRAFYPDWTWRFIAAVSEHHAIFASAALMPWAIGILRYAYALVLSPKR